MFGDVVELDTLLGNHNLSKLTLKENKFIAKNLHQIKTIHTDDFASEFLQTLREKAMPVIQ